MIANCKKNSSNPIGIGVVQGDIALGESIRRAVNANPETFCVGVWNTAEDGLDRISVQRPHVVLMDIDLPGRAGIEATGLLKGLMPDIQVMIVSVDGDHDRIADALKAGACGYLIKPVPAVDRLTSEAGSLSDSSQPVTEMARRVINVLHHQSSAKKQDQKWGQLSVRELEVVAMVSEGLPNKEIACRMGLAADTVKVHLRKIFRKLDVCSRTEVAIKYIKSLEGCGSGRP